MSKLPKLKHTIFETTLPSSGDKVKYRSFTGSEEKTLLVAKETKDLDQILLGIRQIINNCLVDINIDDLPLFDVEWLLLQMRARSVDNKVEFIIKDPDTEEEVKIEINIDDMAVVKADDHTDMIRADEDTFIKMRYPSWEEFKEFLSVKGDFETFQIMVKCIESVYHKDEIIPFEDVDEEDREVFFNDMEVPTINGIKNFFQTMPVLRHEAKYTLKDGTEKTFVLEGTKVFFM